MPETPAVAPPRRRRKTKTKTPPVVRPEDGLGNGFGWDSQVILHNDDEHTFQYVVGALCAVFGHPEQLAAKIMFEAHFKGRSIAQVEDRKNAVAHAAALRKKGLTATVESIE